MFLLYGSSNFLLKALISDFLSEKSFFKNFKSYELIYKTAYNGFVEKKIIGNGAGSFKYFCNNPKFEAYKIIKQKPDDNIIFKLAWKHKNLEILKFHNLFQIKLALSKSIKASATISFQISLNN